jgi:hypothetical protein
MAEQAIPGPEHRRLQSFVGTWATEGTVKTSPSGSGVRFQGVDTYEWIPGGFFLLHRWDTHMPDGRTQGVEIIGYDSASGTYTVHSYDSSGNTDVMHARVANDTWTFEGKSLRFTGGFRDGGDTLAGIWEQRPGEGAPWVHWLDVTLSRVNRQVDASGRPKGRTE